MYKSGEWLAVCDVCQFEYYASQLKRRWDGYMVCEKDWEPRHPLDFIKAKPERAFPTFIRKEEEPTITLTTSPIVVTATVYDTNGNPVVGILPNIANSLPHIATTTTPSITNASGQTVFTVSPASVGETYIRVVYGSVSSTPIRYIVTGT